MCQGKYARSMAMVSVGLLAAAAMVVAAQQRSTSPLTVVVYDFEDAEDRAAPAAVHPQVEAGRFMQPGFFAPPARYFDGSLGGEAGEAIIDRESPRYYDFTVGGLEALDRLERLSFTVTTRQSHAAAGHLVSVSTFKGEDETERPLVFDVYRAGERMDDPEQAAVETYFIGGHVGNARRIVVDLSGLDHADRHTFRIRFDRPRMRSRTALDDVELTALPQGGAR